jgi:chemotaxis methyl-accepting protein methylase
VLSPERGTVGNKTNATESGDKTTMGPDQRNVEDAPPAVAADKGTDQRCLSQILDYVRERRAVDFGLYRDQTIRRRLEHRLICAGVPDCSSYLAYLKGHQTEIDELIDSLLLKVSAFFRDPLVFEVLREFALPDLVDAFHNANMIRTWSAGCARGEEAYSVAILLHEVFRKTAETPPLLILGTDIDGEALRAAEAGVYAADAVAEVKKARLDRHFSYCDGRYRVNNDIRSMVTFARHDITAELPAEGIFSDYHLILCRNVLICFNRDLADQILLRFSDALLPKGYLVLGDAETLPSSLAGRYEQVFPRVKVFRKR